MNATLRFYVRDLKMALLTSTDRANLDQHLARQAAEFLSCNTRAIAIQWIAFSDGENNPDLSVEFSYAAMPFGTDRPLVQIDSFAHTQLSWLQVRAPLPPNFNSVAFSILPLPAAQMISAERARPLPR